MHGTAHGLARRDVNERAVLEERRIERGERIVLPLGISRQMLLDYGRVILQRGGQAADFDALGLREDRRKFAGEMSIHEDQPARRDVAKRKPFQGCGFQMPGRECRAEWQPRDGSNIGKAPILIIQRGEAKLGKPGNAGLAHGEQPGWTVELRFELLEPFPVGAGFFHGLILSRLWHSAKICFAALSPNDLRRARQIQGLYFHDAVAKASLEANSDSGPYKKKGRTTGPAFSHGTLENKAHQQRTNSTTNGETS